jgi:hypothetical protein
VPHVEEVFSRLVEPLRTVFGNRQAAEGAQLAEKIVILARERQGAPVVWPTARTTWT